jgi:hypothetical protein
MREMVTRGNGSKTSFVCPSGGRRKGNIGRYSERFNQIGALSWTISGEWPSLLTGGSMLRDTGRPLSGQ